MTYTSNKPELERLRQHAEQAIRYEEEGAAKDGMTPDSTWDEWQRGKDILSLIEQFEAYRIGLRDLLDVAERTRGGDRSLDPEEWYAIRDYCKNLPGLLDSNPASRQS